MSKVKFVSKHSNYMIVLKPGIEGNRATGTQPIPGIYVKFQDGMVDVGEEKHINLLREHPGYGNEFMEVKEEDKDPYAGERVSIEPGHVVSEMEHGKVGRTVKDTNTQITPQMRKLIEAEAVKMIPDLLKSNPQILKDIIVDMAKAVKAEEPKDALETSDTIPNTIPDTNGSDPKTKTVEKTDVKKRGPKSTTPNLE